MAIAKRKIPIPKDTTPTLRSIDASFPPKFQPFFEPHAIKVLYGGRASSKSWSVARALLLLGQRQPIRVMCAREQMNSIDRSVHPLLCEQIYLLGLEEFYEIEKYRIRGKVLDPTKPTERTEFLFAGLKSNPAEIKSTHGLTHVWVEEAANVSAYSWRVLLPTIRTAQRDGNPPELWIVFNPEHPTDATWKMFVENKQDDDTLIVKMNYYDNPYLPPNIQRQIETMKKNNYDDYLHVYEGEPIRYFEGAVYASELKEAFDDGRVTRVHYDPKYSVEAFFDLGYSDSTAIWFAQRVGTEIHVIDYLENSRKNSDFYVKEIENKPYPVARYWLPHDARQKTSGTGLSWEDLMRAKGKNIRITPNLSVNDGINAARVQFPMMYFDETRCNKGIDALRHYRFEVVGEDTDSPKSKPVHDKYSNAADAFRYMCIALRPEKQKEKRKYNEYSPFSGRATSWMSL